MILFLRALERIHGHLGWLTVAALLHPAILLRNPNRRARLSVALATSMVLVTAIIGAYIYPEYRMRLKQRIWIDSPTVGAMFERKEHLAVAAVAFTLAGCVAHFMVPIITDESAKRTASRIAHRAFVFAFIFATIVASIGVWVASVRSF